MGLPDDWKTSFERELKQAEDARARGNEGMARVCARRAAGVIAGEYLRRLGRDSPGSSAYDRLRFLLQVPGISPQARDAIEKLLLRVTVDHDLPVQIDLIGAARKLATELLEDRREA